MSALESYLSGTRDFVLGRLEQMCGVVWLPLLLGVCQARRVLLGRCRTTSPPTCPPPDRTEEDLDHLLAISM